MPKKIKAYRVRVVSEVVVFATNAEDAKDRAANLLFTARGMDHEGIAQYAGYLAKASGTSARQERTVNVPGWGFDFDSYDEFETAQTKARYSDAPTIPPGPICAWCRKPIAECTCTGLGDRRREGSK
jgi:hypothetical protein